MGRVRVSTTVDEGLLGRARRAHGRGTDASLLEAALEALLRNQREAEVDRAYAEAYRAAPSADCDEWGDLGAFLDAVRRS